jgi:protein gp37
MVMNKTKIEWCDDTSNFVTGCLHGCSFCYARRMAHRFAGKEGTVYHRLKEAGCDPFDPAIHLDVLRKLKDRLKNVKSSRRVFIASMGDICCKTWFHRTDCRRENHSMEKVTTIVQKNVIGPGDVLQFIHRLCRQFDGNHHGNMRHTFLLLSKNPRIFQSFEWPDNAHVGTSIDRTDNIARARLAALSGVVAGVRWVSVEPLLDPAFRVRNLKIDRFKPEWVVIGGLSGKKSLPKGCDVAAERIVLWCKQEGIPVYLKDNLPRLNIEPPQEYP